MDKQITLEQYQIALAALQFHQAKVEEYLKITRAYNYQIEKKKPCQKK